MLMEKGALATKDAYPPVAIATDSKRYGGGAGRMVAGSAK